MKIFKKALTPVIVLGSLIFSSVVYGDSWEENKRLTSNRTRSNDPSIAVDGLNIYVVWNNIKHRKYEIYFKRSVDGGVTWTKDKRLTNNAGTSWSPAIAVGGLNIYMVWNDYTPGNPEIYFKRSVDGGVTWSANKRLTNTSGESWNPAIAVDGLNIYVVWEDDRPGNIYFKRSVDGGVTWSANKRLSNYSGSDWNPAIAVNGSTVYVVWNYRTQGQDVINFKRSVDGGVAWSAGKRLSNISGNARNPAIAVDGANIYLVFDYFNGYNHKDSAINFKRSVDGGVSWTAEERLTKSPSVYFHDFSIAVAGPNISLSWHDDPSGNWRFDIFFKRSIDRGFTWTGEMNLSNNGSHSLDPAIGADGSNIYVVWTDNLLRNYEIFFKRGVLD